ncbi:MAG: sigma-70 family RNA polymerase sigma factor, partial [Flavobacteriales bacterium]|nr:sigma-70 family RNA polymerase sigma factor [Flavobacteriales bacterium]
KKDPRHFAPLYEKHFNSVFRFVYSRVQNKDLTADLTSQTFTKALMALSRYEDRGYAFSSWLIRIAINEINMHFRKNSKHKFAEVSENQLITLMVEAEEPADDMQVVVKALNEMEEDQVSLIELRFFEKKSFAQIGEILSVAEDTAKMRVYRALKRLRKLVLEKK